MKSQALEYEIKQSEFNTQKVKFNAEKDKFNTLNKDVVAPTQIKETKSNEDSVANEQMKEILQREQTLVAKMKKELESRLKEETEREKARESKIEVENKNFRNEVQKLKEESKTSKGQVASLDAKIKILGRTNEQQKIQINDHNGKYGIAVSEMERAQVDKLWMKNLITLMITAVIGSALYMHFFFYPSLK